MLSTPNTMTLTKFKLKKFPDERKSLALFDINAWSISKHSDDLHHLLKFRNTVFDIIAVRETRITKQTSLTTNINAQNHGIEFTPPESSAGGTLLDIASHLSYKLRPDINIYKANQLDICRD